MRNGEMALRFSIVFSVIGFVALAAALYETDRREKSSSTTRERDLIELNHTNPNFRQSSSGFLGATGYERTPNQDTQ
jgi:phage portal protein BeeE